MTLILSFVTGCSTLDQTVMSGAGIGAATGAVIGFSTAQTDKYKNAAIGSLTGALISGVFSYFLHKNIEQRDEKIRRETLFNLDKYDVSVPYKFDYQKNIEL